VASFGLACQWYRAYPGETNTLPLHCGAVYQDTTLVGAFTAPRCMAGIALVDPAGKRAFRVAPVPQRAPRYLINSDSR